MYLKLLGVISIGLSDFDEFDSEAVQGIEVIRSVSNNISVDVKESQILEDSVFELSL